MLRHNHCSGSLCPISRQVSLCHSPLAWLLLWVLGWRAAYRSCRVHKKDHPTCCASLHFKCLPSPCLPKIALFDHIYLWSHSPKVLLDPIGVRQGHPIWWQGRKSFSSVNHLCDNKFFWKWLGKVLETVHSEDKQPSLSSRPEVAIVWSLPKGLALPLLFVLYELFQELIDLSTKAGWERLLYLLEWAIQKKGKVLWATGPQYTDTDSVLADSIKQGNLISPVSTKSAWYKWAHDRTRRNWTC